MSQSEGRPIVRRFVIRRHNVATLARNPWVVRDRSRPAFLGQYASFTLAIESVISKLREERGLPPRIKW